MQCDKPWYSAKNLKVLQAERKNVEKLLEKLTKTMLVHAISCPEVFQSKNITAFVTDINNKLEEGCVAECESTI
eukprot:8436315-Lingulodinium_polyedra.AAC.1